MCSDATGKGWYGKDWWTDWKEVKRMAAVSMGACTVLEVRTGVSTSGNPWGRLKFLAPDYDVWECFVGGDMVASLSGVKQGSVMNVTADFKPTQYVGKDGNIQQAVRMNLVEILPSY